jgi:uncharacterized membrane protein SirB2
MPDYSFIKYLHMSCACLSVLGFCLRAGWLFYAGSLPRRWPVKTLPHIVDTLLLLSAVSLVYQLNLSIYEQAWLQAKIAALLLYIGCGLLLFRFAGSTGAKFAAFAGAITCVLFIFTVALSRNPAGFLQFI